MKIISSHAIKSIHSIVQKLIHSTCFALLAIGACNASAGFYVSGKDLKEGNGNNFIMRGVNVPHAWFAGNTNQSLTDIANTGANTVRVVLSNGHLWSATPESQVSSIISQAKARSLITVLEVHDTTGYGEQSAATLSQAVDYWISIRNSLMGQEDYVIINIGNEPMGNGQPASAWVNGHRDAIVRLRNAGFTHTLMVDAANWGQDWENIMRSNASTVFNSDPRRNVVFSVHMYQVYPNNTAVNNYMTAFNTLNLPLVVGEFAADHFGEYVDANSIMARAQQYGFGYLGWSWSGNNSDLASLNIVNNFNAGSLTTWGNMLINGTNGIRNTSRRATVFSGGSSCSATGITPYLRVNGGSWQKSAAATISSGNTVDFGPHPTSGGSWTWAGCGTSGTGRAKTTNPTSTCTATATYTNSCGAKSTQNFAITVSGSSGGSGSGGTCNWYGTSYPLCANQSSGWGWENNRSCVGSSTCNSQ